MLQVVGEYHLGEFVNRFRAGSLVMKMPDSEAAAIPTMLFATINGVIGLVASLPKAQFEFLNRLQVWLRFAGLCAGSAGFVVCCWLPLSVRLSVLLLMCRRH